ncbi:EEF1B2 isoform 10 [Pan troglodytes]|uniref:EEF1B2 isoform 10 n=1 Tax=Pan troglodytes TaxID=9598 RepID=A0A2J8N5P7_PANTR|nr:EEF1B2 isoform 10 [Pan troglodytes]
MGFGDLKSPAGLQVCVNVSMSLAGMCHHKQMWQYLKPCPAHRLPTCVMPYVGIITSSLTKRKRPACQE